MFMIVLFEICVCFLTFFFVFDVTGVSSFVIADLQTKNDKAKIEEHCNAVLYRAFRFTIVVPTQVIALTLIFFVLYMSYSRMLFYYV